MSFRISRSSKKKIKYRIKNLLNNPTFRYTAKILGGIVSTIGIILVMYKNNKRFRTKVNDIIIDELNLQEHVKVYKFI